MPSHDEQLIAESLALSWAKEPHNGFVARIQRSQPLPIEKELLLSAQSLQDLQTLQKEHSGSLSGDILAGKTLVLATKETVTLQADDRLTIVGDSVTLTRISHAAVAFNSKGEVLGYPVEQNGTYHILSPPFYQNYLIANKFKEESSADNFSLIPFSQSFAIDNGIASPLGRVLGEGVSGRVTEMEIDGEPACIKEIILDIHDIDSINAIKKEAEALRDLNLLILRENEMPFRQVSISPSQIQITLKMKNLGKSLSQVDLRGEENANARLNAAIELLTQVDDLHSGKLSQRGTPYAHRDIKPVNVLIKDGHVNLIDFGTVTTELQNKERGVGTRAYYSYDTSESLRKAMASTLLTQEEQNAFMANNYAKRKDEIATLLTIFHPLYADVESERASIYGHSGFNRLPEPLQHLLAPQSMQAFFGAGGGSLKLVACALIFYNHTNHISDEDIEKLKSNPHAQEILFVLDKNLNSMSEELIQRHISDLQGHLEFYVKTLADDYHRSFVPSQEVPAEEHLERQFKSAQGVLKFLQSSNDAPKAKLAKAICMTCASTIDIQKRVKLSTIIAPVTSNSRTANFKERFRKERAHAASTDSPSNSQPIKFTL